jgi:hypothetical protein
MGISNTRDRLGGYVGGEALTRKRAWRQQIALLGMYRETCPKPVADGYQVVQHDSGIVVRHINLDAVRKMRERLVNHFPQQQLNLDACV